VKKPLALVVVCAGIVAAGCGGDSESAESLAIDPGEGGNYAPDIDPADFVGRIDNTYLPFTPGSTWVYESEDGAERIEIEVLEETREVMGITATVVRDSAYEDGELVEDTYDWFAQDSEGNVWYLGEDTTEYEDGQAVSTAGAWEAGVDGALPGIIMYANPVAGAAYRQEFYAGEAEDMAEVVALDGSESVPFGDFDNLVVIKEWSPLEPTVAEHKYFAAGVGLVLEVKVAGEEGRVELISYEPSGGSSR
jgi:hypothetical protein